MTAEHHNKPFLKSLFKNKLRHHIADAVKPLPGKGFTFLFVCLLSYKPHFYGYELVNEYTNFSIEDERKEKQWLVMRKDTTIVRADKQLEAKF